MNQITKETLVSVVIPVMNEAENVPRLYMELARVADVMSGRWEFVLVDDGSKDGTWEALTRIRAQDERVRAIRFKRNFGQTAAMACGIERAQGDVIVTMDGDLQNDPADMPAMIKKLDEGYDVVCGWRHQRQDKLWTRRVPSLIANQLIGWLTGVRLHDYGCSLKAYRAATIKRTPLYAEFHRYITALVTLTGALVTEMKVRHHPRRFGRTKYNLWRTWRVALDMVTVSVLVKFAAKPLRFFGILGCCSLAVALGSFSRAWGAYVSPHEDILQILPGISLLSFWLAGHLLVVGLVAELCLATAHARPEQLVATEGAH